MLICKHTILATFAATAVFCSPMASAMREIVSVKSAQHIEAARGFLPFSRLMSPVKIESRQLFDGQLVSKPKLIQQNIEFKDAGQLQGLRTASVKSLATHQVRNVFKEPIDKVIGYKYTGGKTKSYQDSWFYRKNGAIIHADYKAKVGGERAVQLRPLSQKGVKWGTGGLVFRLGHKDIVPYAKAREAQRLYDKGLTFQKGKVTSRMHPIIARRIKAVQQAGNKASITVGEYYPDSGKVVTEGDIIAAEKAAADGTAPIKKISEAPKLELKAQ